MKILVTGNPNYGVAESICKIYPEAKFKSKTGEFDLTLVEKQDELSNIALDYDVLIICGYIRNYVPNILLQKVYDNCKNNSHKIHIIVIGSTVDRVKDGRVWKYAEEKKALRDLCNTLAMHGVWKAGPKVSYISFGTLSNNKDKHPDRNCMDINKAGEYIKWVIDQPQDININEISIDPMQNKDFQ